MTGTGVRGAGGAATVLFAVAFWLGVGVVPARAACVPPSGSASNNTVTCSGVTINQNNVAGYGGGQLNVTLNVLPGASVTGSTIGILLGNNAAIDNRGSIIGANGTGVFANGTLRSLTNSGSITGTSHGIEADIITSLTNSGLISGGSPAGFATRESIGGDTQLTLLAGSVLVGRVDLGGGGVNTLNVGKGLSMATTFASGAPVIGSMNVPFVVNGNQVVTADTTSFANQSTMLADLTGGIFSTVENRIDNLRSGVSSFAQPMVTAYAADAASSGPWAGFGSGGGVD